MAVLAKLVPLVNTSKLKTIDINKHQYVLGRLPACDYVFGDLRSSSRHAIIYFNSANSKFILQDLATNGTFLNNKKIGKGNKVPLKNNDSIQFVRQRLEFRFQIMIKKSSPKKVLSPKRTQNNTLSVDPLADTQINDKHSLEDLTLSPSSMNNIIRTPPKVNPTPNRKRKQEWNDDHNDNDDNGPPKKKRKILSHIDDEIVPLKPNNTSFDLFDSNNSNNSQEIEKKEGNKSNHKNKDDNNNNNNNNNNGKKLNKLKNPKRMRAGDVRNLDIEKKSGLFDGVIACIIAKKSRRLDIIMKKFIENDGELYDETDINDNYDLLKDINTIIMTKTMPYIKLTKTIKDETLIPKLHIVTLDWISSCIQHNKILNTRKYIPKSLKNAPNVNPNALNKSQCPAKQSVNNDDNDDEDEDFDINADENEEKASEEKKSDILNMLFNDSNNIQHSDNEENDDNDDLMATKSIQQKDDFIIEQIENKLLIIRHKDWKSSTKILSFDLDGTVITTQSGNRFPRNYKDFRLLYDWTFVMEKKILKYMDDGYSFVMFSNQKLSHLKKKPADYHKKLSDIKLKVPMIMKYFRNKKENNKLIPFVFMAALNDDIFRKPHRGMFEYFNKNINLYDENELVHSIFVGDAAGREKGWKNGRTGKADFSSSDRCFALNCKLKFYTPEEFWVSSNKCQKYRLLPIQSILKQAKINKYPQELVDLNNSEQEMIIFIGYPGCGKSTLFRKFFYIHNYKWINRDTLGSMDKCEILCREYVKDKYSVVIDNTNPSKMARKRFIQIANENNIKIRAIWITIDRALAHHLNVMRWRMNQCDTIKIPVSAYKQFDKQFNKPQLIEGFTSIIKVPFVFDETLQEIDEFLLYT